MPATNISICNLALANIRVPAITGFSDGTTQANVAQQVYSEIYEQCLGEHRWRFAMKQIQLTPLTSPPYPPAGWSQLYQLPAAVLQIHTVRAVGTPSLPPSDPDYDPWESYEDSAPRWDRYGDKLVTQLTPDYTIVLDYTQSVTEANLPPYYRKYLVASLQMTFAVSITGKSEYFDAAEKEAEVFLRRARLKDSQGRTPPRTRATRFLTYR
jgi:hypothetical protein